ncbi:MAG: hypothetical protein AB1792_08995 [Candidatus Zixiibacteriota bacterium]
MRTIIRKFIGTCLLGSVVIVAARPAGGQRTPNKAQAELEARIVVDSMGCPVAVDLWLASTTDTVHGIEALLRWDRPDCVRFAPAPPVRSTKKGHAADTTSRPRLPVAADAAAIKIAGGLVADWELVEARSSDGLTVKVTALSALMPGHKATALVPGKSGRICRLPLNLETAARPQSLGDSLSVWLDQGKTRLSNAAGALFGDLVLKKGSIELRHCRPESFPRR